MADSVGVGWQIGRFALACVAPSTDGVLTSVQVWEAYLAWCQRHALSPMAEALFAEDFAALAAEIGVPLIKVNGNESYHQLALIPGVAHVDG